MTAVVPTGAAHHGGGHARDCRDGADNDGDGVTDLLDPGCTSRRDPSELGTAACDDGADNDHDGLADFADAGCSSGTDASEFGTTVCDDGLDNDGDGTLDAEDAGCTDPSDGTEATTEWYAGPALWDDTQNVPHPDFGWATLSNPPEGELPEWWAPVPAAATPANVSRLEHVAAAPDGMSSDWDIMQFMDPTQPAEKMSSWEIAVFGSIAVVPGSSAGTFVPCKTQSGPNDGGSAGQTYRDLTGGQQPPWTMTPDCILSDGHTKSLTTVLDISDPANPAILSQFEPKVGSEHNYVAILAFPDGRLVAAFSANSGHDIWDLTDPTAPVHLAVIKWPNPNCTGCPTAIGLANIPGTPIMFNANRQAPNNAHRGDDPPNGINCNRAEDVGPEVDLMDMCGWNQMYDLSDPSNPVMLADFESGAACHEISFWSDGSAYRGICAGEQYTQIWDLADPYAPAVVATYPAPHATPGTPALGGGLETVSTNFLTSHSAGLSADGNILYTVDAVKQGDGKPACAVSVNTSLGSASAPLGAISFYDVSDLQEPQLIGWYSAAPRPDMPNLACTAKQGTIVPDPDRDLMAASFAGAGVVLLDFTPLRTGGLPVVLDQWADDSDAIRTVYDNGYLFVGDRARGFDVLGFD